MSKADIKKSNMAMVTNFQKYVNTYDITFTMPRRIFINDMLYGIGLAVNPDEHRLNNGFAKFKKELLKHVLTDKEQVWLKLMRDD